MTQKARSVAKSGWKQVEAGQVLGGWAGGGVSHYQGHGHFHLVGIPAGQLDRSFASPSWLWPPSSMTVH